MRLHIPIHHAIYRRRSPTEICLLKPLKQRNFETQSPVPVDRNTLIALKFLS